MPKACTILRETHPFGILLFFHAQHACRGQITGSNLGRIRCTDHHECVVDPAGLLARKRSGEYDEANPAAAICFLKIHLVF